MQIYLYTAAPAATLLAARHLALMEWSLKAYAWGESPPSEFEMLQTLRDTPSARFIRQQQPKTIVALPCPQVRDLCSVAFDAQIQASPRHRHLSTVHSLVEEQIGNIEQVMGECERSHESPTPPTYRWHLSRLMVRSLLILPVSFVATKLSTIGVVVLVTTIASYILIDIGEVATEIEDVFRLLPVQQLASAVQAAVRNQFLRIGDVPLIPE